MNPENSPHIFSKRVYKSLVAAETVLGPKAIRRIIEYILTDTRYISLNDLLNSLDPKAQVIIKTGQEMAGGLVIDIQPKEAIINDTLEGYTLVDIKTAIAEAIRDDLTGFVLQALQFKWERDLTLEEAENITFHLNKLIKLIK